MSVTMKFEGGRALDRELEKLKASTGKGAARRSLKKAAAPLAEAMRSRAPRDESPDLAESIAVTSKLSPRQRKLHRKWGTRSAVEMFVGAGPLPEAHLQEFGTAHHAPQPWARPAWDADKADMLRRLSDELWRQISRSVARAEAKARREAAGG